jgi:hypothetical protein
LPRRKAGGQCVSTTSQLQSRYRSGNANGCCY